MGGTINVAADGTSIRLHLKKTKISANKLDWDEKVTVEKVARIGQMGAQARTKGKYEASDSTLTVEALVWYLQILPLLPANGLGSIPFPVKAQWIVPGVGTAALVGVDCRIIGTKGSIEASEKAGMVDIPLSVMRWWHKDGSKGWHSLCELSSEPVASARELML